MAKNIIVLCDGTGQDGGQGHDSNVYKLYRMLEDRTDRQIVFYDEGLGTGQQKLAGMAFGAGIDTNILQAYRFIFDNYHSGDKIFLFGFSRGAATVRSLSSFIHYFGILPTARPGLIEQAYRIYKNRKRSYDQSDASGQVPEGTFKLINSLVNSFNHARQYDLDGEKGASVEFVRKHPNQWVSIEFLGVWDTVPALGLVASPVLDALVERVPAWKHQYHNFKLRKSVRHACHALSIDDERKWFLPNIWKEKDVDKDGKSSQKVEQVWFGGSHTDVGGGFWEAGFSDISLEWMIGRALEHGLRLYLKSRDDWNFCLAPDAVDEFHDPRSKWGVIYASGKRDHTWDTAARKTFGPPRIHESVLERAREWRNDKDPMDRYHPWILDHGLTEQDIKNAWTLWLEEEYLHETKASYDQARASLQGKLDLAEWRAISKNTLKRWMVRTHNTFEEWQSRHIQEFRDGAVVKKFLVEPATPVEYCSDDDSAPILLRDYDRTRGREFLEDQKIDSNLWKRAREINQEKLREYGRSEKKKILSDPDRTPYKYRTDLDHLRWKRYDQYKAAKSADEVHADGNS